MAYEKTNWTSTTPISTGNLNKIEEGINVANKIGDYSTEEQVIGTWLGKPLYRKVIEFRFDISTWNEGARWFEKATGEFLPSDLEYSFLRLWHVKELMCTLPSLYAVGTELDKFYNVSYYYLRNFVRLYIGTEQNPSQWANYTQQLVVEYTKTTD